MSGMFRIALELSIPKIGFNIMLSLTVKKLDAFKLDEVTESDNTECPSTLCIVGTGVNATNRQSIFF